MTRKEILERALDFYGASRDANGLPYRDLEKNAVDLKRLEKAVVSAAGAGILEVRFESAETNPHIRRLPRHLVPDFEYNYGGHGLERSCVYPSVAKIAERLDLSRFKNEPYTERLWAGGNHLDLVFFELAVLDRYRDDPRFRYQQHFFGGSIHLKDEHYIDEDFPEKDKSFLERFGIAYDPRGHRVLGVLLSDLRRLSPEHQRAWHSHEVTEPCKLNEATFNSLFLGKWSEFGSVFEALPAELSVVNEMARIAFGKRLFKNTFEDGVPSDYGVLLRPTKKEFLNFARALDLMLSENIDPAFFPGWVQKTRTVTKDDRETIETVGSIQLLDEWLRRSFRATDGNPSNDVCKPMRDVRAQRSKASHHNIEDVYDHSYEQKQRELMHTGYGAVRTMRLILANYPGTDAVDVPEWLFNGDIKVP